MEQGFLGRYWVNFTGRKNPIELPPWGGIQWRVNLRAQICPRRFDAHWIAQIHYQLIRQELSLIKSVSTTNWHVGTCLEMGIKSARANLRAIESRPRHRVKTGYFYINFYCKATRSWIQFQFKSNFPGPVPCRDDTESGMLQWPWCILYVPRGCGGGGVRTGIARSRDGADSGWQNRIS